MTQPGPPPRRRNTLLRLLDLREQEPAEWRAVLWGGVTFGLVLLTNYLLRPIRENINYELGDRTDELFLGTLVMITLLNPLLMVLANLMPSRRFVPLGFAFFAVVFGVFALLFRVTDLELKAGMGWREPAVLVRAGFFVWLSTFNVLATTLFWIGVVERFRPARAKRLFGLIGVGGTAGVILGSATAMWLAKETSPADTIGLGALVLVGAMFTFERLHRAGRELPEIAEAGAEPVGRAGVFEGLRLFLGMPTLWGIGAYMMLLGVLATAFYYQKNQIVGGMFADGAEREWWFALMDLVGNSIVLVVQLFATGRILVRCGLAAVLCLLPVCNAAGLGALAWFPSLATLVVVEVVRRAMQYALDKPAREVLYTPLPLEAKHKSKTFTDTFLFRLGDWIGAVLQSGLKTAHTTSAQLAWGALPVAAAWAGLGWWLGRRQERAERDATGGQPVQRTGA